MFVRIASIILIVILLCWQVPQSTGDVLAPRVKRADLSRMYSRWGDFDKVCACF
jgi:hypothetical protein